MEFLLSSHNVFDYLIKQCLCSEEEQTHGKVELQDAKNFNLVVTLPEERKLLVKQERSHREGETAAEFFHEWRIQECLQRFPKISPLRSWIADAIYFDAENSIIVFNYLNNYRDLMDCYVQENILRTEDAVLIASDIGTALATLHRLTLDHQEYQEFFSESCQPAVLNPTLHLVNQLEPISPEIFGLVPSDGLKFFALYQRYDSLGQAIAQLTSAFQPCCLTHNDLKLNNILLSINWHLSSQLETSDNSIVRLIDWERSAWGDPAFDLGTLIASYLQIWLSSLITSKASAIDESLANSSIYQINCTGISDC